MGQITSRTRSYYVFEFLWKRKIRYYIRKIVKMKLKHYLLVILSICIMLYIYMYLQYVKYHMTIPIRSDPNAKFLQIGFDVLGKTRRLGNTMFAYASVLGIAKEIGAEAIIEPDSELANIFKVDGITKIPRNCMECRDVRCEIISETKAYIYDKALLFNITTKKYIKLRGFFLSWKYFHTIEEQLRQDFRFHDNILHTAQTILHQNRIAIHQNTKRVGIHIRRGDILNLYFAHYGYISADVEYITKAMDYFRTKHINSTIQFIVCSDDIVWAKASIKSDHIYFSEGETEVVDMALLSLCDSLIMTTGTFGWWAGWLAQGDVVYLKHWYVSGSELSRCSDGQSNDEDFMPPNWIAL